MKLAPPAARTDRASDPRRMAVKQYSLMVDGELSDELADAFAGMTLTRKEGRTLLVGEVRDQAELYGLLQQVLNLGLTLLSASTTDEGRASA